MTEFLVGVDLGTTGTKTAVYRSDGTPVAEANAEVPLRWHGPGRVDQDPDDFYRSAAKTISRCLKESGVDPGRVAALGITGQMAGVLGLGAGWQPSTPYDSWLDLRCSEDVDWLERELGDELVEKTGCPPMVDHAPKIRWWLREHPDTFDATEKWIMPSSYVAGKIAGLDTGDAFIDRTYLHFTGLAEAREGVWSDELTEAMNVPVDRLPHIVEPSTVIGEVTAVAAADCGLRKETPVAAGLGDTAAGALGAGIVRSGQLLDTAGTAAVLAASTREFRSDARERTLIIMRGAVPGQWVPLSFLSGGSLLTWFRDALVAGGKYASEPSLDELTAEAEKAPAGAEGLLFVPHLDGRLLPNDPAMRGAWIGLNRHHERAHLARAVLEGVAYEYAIYLRVLLDLHPELSLDETRVIGGGARSDAWNRIKASVLGVPYVRLDREEFSCWGAALVAGHAVGLFEDLTDAAERSTAVKERYEPDPEDHAAYQRIVEIYRDSLGTLAGPSHRLVRLDSDGGGESP
jgi:xylulokinase